MSCDVCGSGLPNFHHLRKYCSPICRFRSVKKFDRECVLCKSKFIGRKNQKYCSQKCSATDRPEHIRQIQEARRKYPKIDGLNKAQVFLRFNPKKRTEYLSRDNMKRCILLQYLGGKCVKCGYDKDLRALQIDHINNDGWKDRKERKTTKVYRFYLKNKEKCEGVLQVLCANCHAIKTYENALRKE